jgi:cobalamin biosynthesis protein CobT
VKINSRKRRFTLVDMLGESRISRLLFEKEGDEDEATDEEDEDTEEESDSDADSTADEEAEEETEDEEDGEEVPVETSVEDEIRLKDKLDTELSSVFTGFETRARKKASLAVESKRFSIMSILREESEPGADQDFDLDQFADDTARLIQNYDSLLDMEAIIYNKAKQFLTDKYGSEVASALREILVDRYGIDFMEDEPGLEEPIAVVGAGGGGGGV